MVRNCKTDGCGRIPAPGNDYCAVCRQNGKHLMARDRPDKFEVGGGGDITVGDDPDVTIES
jgi:hypothetical protein